MLLDAKIKERQNKGIGALNRGLQKRENEISLDKLIVYYILIFIFNVFKFQTAKFKV